jgi:hypothetical protein
MPPKRRSKGRTTAPKRKPKPRRTSAKGTLALTEPFGAMRLNAHTALDSLPTTSPVMGSAPLVPSSHGSTASAGTQTHGSTASATHTAPSAQATPTPATKRPAPAFTSRAKPQPTPSAKPQPSASASAAEAAKKAAREAAEVEAIRQRGAQAWGVIQHATNRAAWYNSTPSRREAVRADNPRYLRRAPRKHTPILEAVHRVV